MKKKIFSMLMLIPAICMTVSWNAIPADTKVSMEKMKRFEAAADSEDSINEAGTFHDDSWDGVSLKEIDSSKDDSKKNLVHDYKVVKGKVKDTVTGKVVKGLKVCKDAPAYFVGDDKTRIALSGSWDETIEAVIDYDEKKLGGDYPVFYTYIPSWIEPSPNASCNFGADII